MTDAAIERFARALAEGAAGRLEGFEVAPEPITVTAPVPEISFGRSFPLICASLPYAGIATGTTLVVLAPETAQALVSRLATGVFDDLDEAALRAVALAIEALYAGAGAGDELQLTFGAASASMVHGALDMPDVEPGSWVVAYRLQGDGSSFEVVQTVPGALAAALAPDHELATADPPPIAAGEDDDAPRLAIERASAIAADAAAAVLSDLFAEELSAATPTVDQPPDPVGGFDFPLIVVEVSYLAGLEGSNRFLLQPGDAAQLAAAMMGTPETTGDGLSAIELSAVSEAMNQVMSTTASELSSALGTSIEASPPTCTIIEDAQQARELLGACAYRSRFRLVSTIFSAEIVQLVSPELATSLREVFASSALAREALEAGATAFDAFADLPLSGFEGALPDPPDPRAGARELLSGIRVRVSAELGRSRLPIARVANLPAGSIVVLDRAPSDPVDVLVNGTPFAQAKVVLVDGEYAVQILGLSPLELNG